MENRSNMSNNREKQLNERSLMGSTNDKYAVILNDGRTVVFISDRSKEAEIRLKYESLKDQKYPTRNPKHFL